MSTLITGATGFIGGRLAARLVREDVPVRCLVRATSDTAPLERLGAELVTGDVTDAASLRRAADGCQTVFHCAALVSDWATAREIARVNVEGTVNLLDAAREARFIHISTTDVYGHPGGRAVDEEHEAGRFANWYAQTKLDAEREVRRSGVDHVIIRPATVYGPGSTDVVGQIARAIRNRTMLLIGRGRALAGLCYVENLIDAVLLAWRRPQASGQAFNVTDGLGITWREFTADLARGLDRPPPRLNLPYRLAAGLGFGLEHAYRLLRTATGLRLPPLLSRQAVQVMGIDQDFSHARARAVLGWTPGVDYPTGLEATLAWLRDWL